MGVNYCRTCLCCKLVCVCASAGLTSTASLNRYDLSTVQPKIGDQETLIKHHEYDGARAEALQGEIVMYIVVITKGQLSNNYTHKQQ